MTASTPASDDAGSPPTTPPPRRAITDVKPADRLPPRATVRRCILWVVIAFVAGTTSFMLGLTANEASPTAMALGIAIYGCFIGLASSSRGFRRRLRRPFADRSFRIGYGIRLVSASFPAPRWPWTCFRASSR